MIFDVKHCFTYKQPNGLPDAYVFVVPGVSPGLVLSQLPAWAKPKPVSPHTAMKACLARAIEAKLREKNA